MKDTGKSSSRKLRRVVYYLLYKMDPQKTHYKIGFSTKMLKIQNSRFCFYIFPPHSYRLKAGPMLAPLGGPISPFKGPSLLSADAGLLGILAVSSGLDLFRITFAASQPRLPWQGCGFR